MFVTFLVRSRHHFLFIDTIEKFQEKLCYVLNTFENMENGAYFQIQDISQVSKGIIMF